jgi:hypothetical protein
VLERFKVTALSAGARARTLLATLQGVSADERAPGAEVLFPHGFASRPSISNTLWAIAVRVGDELLPLLLRDKGTAGFSPTLEDGETRIYNLGGFVIRLRGTVLEIDAPGSFEVVVNGGTLKVARDTDPVARAAALATWMLNVEVALNGILGPGAIPPLVGTTIGNIAGGATRFKG